MDCEDSELQPYEVVGEDGTIYVKDGRDVEEGELSNSDDDGVDLPESDTPRYGNCVRKLIFDSQPSQPDGTDVQDVQDEPHFTGGEWDYKCLERPKLTATRRNVNNNNGIADRNRCDPQPSASQPSASASRQQYRRILDSSSDSDYDSYGDRLLKRMRRTSSSSDSDDPVNHGSSGLSTEFQKQAALFQKEAKNLQGGENKKPFLSSGTKHSVWSDLLAEDDMASHLGGFEVAPDNCRLIDRGSESFNVPIPMRQRTRADSESSSVSSNGFSDDTKQYFMPCNIPEARNAAPRRGVKRRCPNEKQKLYDKLQSFTNEKLGEYVTNELEETKDDVIQRAIQLLGKDLTIKLFLKTLKIQRRGGIPIKSFVRNRTAGGVFIYLMRNDRRIKESKVNEILQTDKCRAFSKKKSKQSKAQQSRRMKQRLLTLSDNKSDRIKSEVTKAVATVTSEKWGNVKSIAKEDGELDDEIEDITENEGAYECDGEYESSDGHNEEDCIDLHCDPSDIIL